MSASALTPPLPSPVALATLRLDSDRRLAQFAMALVLIPGLWFVRADLQLFGRAGGMLAGRLAVRSAMIALTLWGLWRLSRVATREAYSRLAMLLAWTIVACLFSLNAMRPQGETLPLRTPLMNLMVLYGALPNARWRQVAPPLVFAAGLVLLRTLWLTGPSPDVPGDVLVLVITSAVGVTMVWRRTALEESEREAFATAALSAEAAKQAASELDSLKGLIPICAFCHHVRTELGAWEQLDRYIRERTDADFSHGICPSCAAKHYPEYHLDERPETP